MKTTRNLLLIIIFSLFFLPAKSEEMMYKLIRGDKITVLYNNAYVIYYVDSIDLATDTIIATTMNGGQYFISKAFFNQYTVKVESKRTL